MSQPPVLLALRAATAAAHAQLEADLDFYRRVAEPNARCTLVAAFFQFHHGVETRIHPWLDKIAGLDFAGRRRAPLILRDLNALGGEEPKKDPMITVGSLGSALGWMYVLEGNALGGRVIHRTLEGRGISLRGLAFLHPYGDETGERWRSFVIALDQLRWQGVATIPDMIEGAVSGFHHAHAVLCLDQGGQTSIAG